MKNRYEKEMFIEIVKESNNLSDVCRNINLKPYYGNRETVKKYIDEYGIDVSHFKFNNNYIKFNKKNTDEILIEKSTFNTTHLKNRLYKEGLKKRECELCGQKEEWKGKKMSLILDHKNGINNDNRIDNLQIVCPNCNATLDTHGGKNKSKIYNYSTNLKEVKKYYCNCGKEKSRSGKLCVECYNVSQRKVERPSIKILKNDIKELGYVGAGKKYGVSDNSIRKWIKK